MLHLQSLLRQEIPLDEADKKDLRDWLKTLEDDCELFGPAQEDLQRMAQIKAKLAQR